MVKVKQILCIFAIASTVSLFGMEETTQSSDTEHLKKQLEIAVTKVCNDEKIDEKMIIDRGMDEYILKSAQQKNLPASSEACEKQVRDIFESVGLLAAPGMLKGGCGTCMNLLGDDFSDHSDEPW